MMPISDLINYFGPLHDDVERCLVGIEIGDDLEYWKRSYLRCLCTFVEARIYLLKSDLKAVDHLINSAEISQEQLAFLNGTDWKISTNGEIKPRVKNSFTCR